MEIVLISDALILNEKTKGYSFGDSEMRIRRYSNLYIYLPCCIEGKILKYFEDKTMLIDEFDDDLLSKITMTSNDFNLMQLMHDKLLSLYKQNGIPTLSECKV